ncbi:MAG: hypothetical protein AAGF59_07000 [Pseudomonadota bacterium]
MSGTDPTGTMARGTGDRRTASGDRFGVTFAAARKNSLSAVASRLRAGQEVIGLLGEPSGVNPAWPRVPYRPPGAPFGEAERIIQAIYGVTSAGEFIAERQADIDRLTFFLVRHAREIGAAILENRRRMTQAILSRYAANPENVNELAHFLPVMLAARQGLPVPLTAEKTVKLRNRVLFWPPRPGPPAVLPAETKPNTRKDIWPFVDPENLYAKDSSDPGAVLGIDNVEQDAIRRRQAASHGTRYDPVSLLADGSWSDTWSFGSASPFANRAGIVRHVYYQDHSPETWRSILYVKHPVALILKHNEDYPYELADIVRMSDISERNSRLLAKIFRVHSDMTTSNAAFERDLAGAAQTDNAVDWDTYRPVIEAAARMMYAGPNDAVIPVVDRIVADLQPFDFLGLFEKVLLAAALVLVCLSGVGIVAGTLTMATLGASSLALAAATAIEAHHKAALTGGHALFSEIDPLLKVAERQDDRNITLIFLVLELLGAIPVGKLIKLGRLATVDEAVEQAVRQARQLSSPPPKATSVPETGGRPAATLGDGGSAVPGQRTTNERIRPLERRTQPRTLRELLPPEPPTAPKPVKTKTVSEVDQIVEDLLAPTPAPQLPVLYDPDFAARRGYLALPGTSVVDNRLAELHTFLGPMRATLSPRELHFLEAIYRSFPEKLAIDPQTVDEILKWARNTDFDSLRMHLSANTGELYALKHLADFDEVAMVSMVTPQAIPGTRWPDYLVTYADGGFSYVEIRTVTRAPGARFNPAAGRRTMPRVDFDEAVTIGSVETRGVRPSKVASEVRKKVRHGQIAPNRPGYIMVVVDWDSAGLDLLPQDMINRIQNQMRGRPHIHGVYVSYREGSQGYLRFIPNPDVPNGALQ